MNKELILIELIEASYLGRHLSRFDKLCKQWVKVNKGRDTDNNYGMFRSMLRDVNETQEDSLQETEKDPLPKGQTGLQ